MGQPSHPDIRSDGTKILDAQLRESYGRVVYAHKAQEKQADILLKRQSKIGLGQVVLPAISTGGFLTALLGTGWWGSVVGASCSAVLLGLNLYARSHDLKEQAQVHNDAAVSLWSIRERYLSLITDLAIGCTELAVIQDKRDNVMDELAGIYAVSPRTTDKAYKKARVSLNVYEEMTFSATEIDALLPKELRRVQEE